MRSDIFEYDPEVDAAYVKLVEGAAVASTKRLDEQRCCDYGDHGELIGIEFLNVSTGVNVEGLPAQITEDGLTGLLHLAEVAQFLRSYKARMVLPPRNPPADKGNARL